MSNNKLKVTKIFDVGNQLDLDNGEVATGWSASADVTGIATSVTHVTGSTSMSFDKSLTTATSGTISKTIGGGTGKNGSMFAIHKLKTHINLGSLTNMTSVSIVIGTDASHNNVYTTAVASLSTGWNELDYECDSPTSITGNGVNWYEIKYLAITVLFDATSRTLNDILFDTAYLYKLNEAGTVGADTNIRYTKGTELVAEQTTAPAAASEYPVPVGGQYNSSLPTYTDGDRTVFQFDVNGKLQVAQSADIEIGAVEIKDGTTDARQAVKVDNATASATPTVALVGAHYKAALDTYADNDASPFHVTANGILASCLTSGATLTPIFDTVGHSGYVRLSNGTIEPIITAAYAETLALATDHLQVGAGMYGMDANTGTPIMRAVQVCTDNDATSATPNVLLTGGVYKAALDTYTDENAAPIPVTANGVPIVALTSGATLTPILDTNAHAGFVHLTDGTSDLTLGTGTVKTVPTEIHDGTNGVDVIATILSLKTDLSSVAGTVTDVNTGSMSAGTQRITLADDDTQFGSVGEAAAVDGAVHAQLRYIGSAVDGLEATVPTPAAEYKSPSDFTATYTSNVTITLAGLPFTITDDSQIVYIKYIPTGGSGAAYLVSGQNGVTITESSSVLTVDGAGTPFASADVYEVGINAQKKGYDASLEVGKVIDQSPLNRQYVSESLVDTTNITAATHYYPSSTGGIMDGYSDQSLTGKFIDADGTLTLTYQVSNDEDSTNADWNGAYFYDDELNATVNTKTVTNGTELFSLSVNNNNFRRYRWVVVASGATNTCILKERKKAI